MIRPSIRLRLTAWYASIFLLAGCALLAVSYEIVSRNTSSFPTRVAAEMARRGASPLRTATDSGGLSVTNPGDKPLPRPTRGYIARQAELRAAAEQDVRSQMHRQIIIDFALALLATTIASLLAGWFVAGRMLRPLSRITATARRVATGTDLTQRIEATGPKDELHELASTFDEMLDRLERVFAGQRSFVANASHELRTPLAVIRAEVDDRLDDPNAGEAELREMAYVVRGAINRAEQLITSLLDLASSQSELRRHDPIELRALAQLVAERIEPTADDSLAITVDGNPTVIQGEPRLIERLIENLLENACRYNYPNGFVRLTIETDGEEARLIMMNSGPLVSDEIAPRLFEPFVRADNSRSRDSGGAGLGLSIVAAVVAAHGGEATASPRAEGGLTVVVRIPVRRDARVAEPDREASIARGGPLAARLGEPRL